MLRNGELKRLRPLLLFFLGYTLLFLAWVKTFFYTLPLLLGLLVAGAVQPVIRFLDGKWRWHHTASTLAATGAALGLLLAGVVFLGAAAVRETAAFLSRVAQGDLPDFSPPVTRFLQGVRDFLQELDLDLILQNREKILEWVQGSLGLVLSCLSAVLGVLTSLPTLLTLVLVTGCAAFFFARDMGKLKAGLRGLCGDRAAGCLKSAARSSTGAGRRCLLSYLLLTFITFCQACIILSILGIDYPFTISLVAAAADVLPVLGPGLVFAPLAVYQLLLGEYAKALGLLIGWGIITLVRQVAEPRLVAATVKVHPLTMLAGVYFSLVAGSLWVLLYVLGLCQLYAAFRENGALPSLLPPAEDTKARDL